MSDKPRVNGNAHDYEKPSANQNNLWMRVQMISSTLFGWKMPRKWFPLDYSRHQITAAAGDMFSHSRHEEDVMRRAGGTGPWASSIAHLVLFFFVNSFVVATWDVTEKGNFALNVHAPAIAGLSTTRPRGATISRSELIVRKILAASLRKITKKNEHAVLLRFVRDLWSGVKTAGLVRGNFQEGGTHRK